ncbi:MAG TPA: DUF4129 domain-containing protein [Polyangia bacterium]
MGAPTTSGVPVAPARRAAGPRRAGRLVGVAVAAALALCAAHALAAPAAAPPGPAADEARVRAELARILDHPELRAAGRATGPGAALTVARASLGRWIEGQPAGVTRTVVAACILVLVLIAAHLAVSVRAVLRGDRRSRGAAPDTAPRRSATELRAAAQTAAAAGQHAEAVRLFYLAALAALDAGGGCDLRAGVADYTVVERCGPRAAPLREMVRLFQESRYGGRAVGAAEVDRCRACLDAIAPPPAAAAEAA